MLQLSNNIRKEIYGILQLSILCVYVHTGSREQELGR